MANSGFQHLRFLQIVGRGRWWAHINCQRFLCLVWKLYSMYPGRASALSAPGHPWPVQCHWVLTAGSQSPPAAPPAFCCPLDVTCLTLGVLTWFFTLSMAPGGLPLELHTSLEAPHQGGFIAWAYWAQFGPQITAEQFDSWFEKHPRNICKESKISLSAPVNYIYLTFTFKKAVSSNLSMINSKGINVQHTKSLKYEPSYFGEKQNSRPFCFLFLSLQ